MTSRPFLDTPNRFPHGWVFTLLFIAGMFLPRLVTQGMFGDGLCYAAIARNMAMGNGSFWAPFFSSSFWLPYNSGPVFYEHPPLMMGVLSGFFKLLGDSWWVEKIFCLVVLASSLVLIKWVWRLAFKDTAYQSYAWLACLFWYFMPTVIWAYPNNMLDSFMGIFSLLAIGLQLKALQRTKSSWMFASLAGISLVLAFLSKGPVGLFPLAMPFIYVLIYGIKYTRKAIMTSLVCGGIFMFGFFLLWNWEEARLFLSSYLDQQIVSALKGSREGSERSFWDNIQILVDLGTNLLPPLVLAGIFYGILRIKGQGWLKTPETYKSAGLFLLIGLSASLPIALSPKQSHHYLLPSLPFFALAIASLMLAKVHYLVNNWRPSASLERYSRVIYLLACIGIMGFSLFEMGRVSRDKGLMYDMAKFSEHIPLGSKVGICPEMMEMMGIHVYLQRYYRYELSENLNEVDFALGQKECVPDYKTHLNSSGFKATSLPLEVYTLYQKGQP